MQETYLGEGAVVPQVALVGEAVADEAELALLDVLLDGVEKLFFRDLALRIVSEELPPHDWGPFRPRGRAPSHCMTYFHLSIGPPRHLDDHIEHSLLLVRVQWYIMERRDGHAILLNVDAVLKGVRGTDLAGCVDRGGLAVIALLGDG